METPLSQIVAVGFGAVTVVAMGIMAFFSHKFLWKLHTKNSVHPKDRKRVALRVFWTGLVAGTSFAISAISLSFKGRDDTSFFSFGEALLLVLLFAAVFSLGGMGIFLLACTRASAFRRMVVDKIRSERKDSDA